MEKLFENSKIKAIAVTKRLPEELKNAIVIADDSGLCVDALDGAPGIYSSRFSGETPQTAPTIPFYYKNFRTPAEQNCSFHLP